MSNKDSLKSFCLAFSKAVDDYFSVTLAPECRASDLQDYGKIKLLLKKHDFETIYVALRAVKRENLADLIPCLRIIVAEQKTEWHFKRRTKKKPTEKPTELSKPFRIEDITDQKIYFSERELTILNKYKSFLEDLINGIHKPTTPAQERFILVSKHLLLNAREKEEPRSYFEKLIVKYIYHSRILTNRSSGNAGNGTDKDPPL